MPMTRAVRGIGCAKIASRLPVRVEPGASRGQAGSMETYVIVGASLAGAKAAETLRDEGFDGDIVLIGEEGERPYERPPLSKGYLLGAEEREKAYVHDEKWYADQRIDLRLGWAPAGSAWRPPRPRGTTARRSPWSRWTPCRCAACSATRWRGSSPTCTAATAWTSASPRASPRSPVKATSRGYGCPTVWRCPPTRW